MIAVDYLSTSDAGLRSS